MTEAALRESVHVIHARRACDARDLLRATPGTSPWPSLSAFRTDRRCRAASCLLPLLLCNAILEVASLRLRGALGGASRLSRMSHNGKLPTLPGNVRTWRGSHYRRCGCQSDDERHSHEGDIASGDLQDERDAAPHPVPARLGGRDSASCRHKRATAGLGVRHQAAALGLKAVMSDDGHPAGMYAHARDGVQPAATRSQS